MNRPVSRRTLLGASAVAVGAVTLPTKASALAELAHPDVELFKLIERWGLACAVSDAAGERSDTLWEELCDLEPERPFALHYSGADGLNCGFDTEILPNGRTRLLYGLAEVEKLREAPLPTRCEETFTPHPCFPNDRIVHRRSVPDERRMARRAEVIAAHDAWWAEVEVVKDRLGIPAADETWEAASTVLHEVEAAILTTVPSTATGLIAKARWATGAHAPLPDIAVWSAKIAADVIAMAERGGWTL